MQLEPEDVDLEELAQTLSAVPLEHRRGYVRGKTAMREVVVRKLACSEEMAEQLVDTLALRGFLRFVGDTSETLGPGYWKVERDEA